MASVEQPPHNTPVAAEIADLLDQCTAEELTTILGQIEGGKLTASEPAFLTQAECPQETEPDATQTAPVTAPVSPPSAPPPQGRRPAPAVKPAQAEAIDEAPVSTQELKKILAEHGANVIAEVKELLIKEQPPADTVDAATLTNVLAERDQEVSKLEAQLAELQEVLASKDKRVAELGADLDTVVREVRHRQLDLEFQQLKLEERVRSNTELEQVQRKLAAQVEEVSLNARHAALEADSTKTTGAMSPRSVRVQGTLPWTLRSKRPAGALTS
mmetsp:Transcript_68650/g.128064  ORF Transcript_68650/g.128064 Transcript_68650/m.128064 type:complete len:272 (+) Transcript_68650:112-927(+)